MIDYEATIRNMELRYAELYASFKESELRLYKAYIEAREMRERPDIAVVENVRLRKQLFNERLKWATRERDTVALWRERALYTAKMFWTMMGYLKGEILFQQLPTWVRKNLFPENRWMVGG